MSIGTNRLVTIVALALTGLVFATGTSADADAARKQPIQAVLHGYGCGDPITISAVDRTGRVTDDRVIVRGKPGFQLIPKIVSTDQKQFLFMSFDCENNTHTLYRQYLGRKPTAEPLMVLPNEWWMVGVTWDIARAAPAVLIRDPNFNYQLQVLNPTGWSTLWSGSRSDFDGKFPSGIESRSGYEYLIVGDNLRDSWSMWSITTSGRYSGFLSESLTGPGEILEIADGFSDRTNTYVGPDGTWICDWSARGTIQDAIAQGKCATVPGGAGYRGVSILGEGNREWLVLTHLLGPSSQTQYECLGESFLSCGTPKIGERQASALNGNEFAYVYIGEGMKYVKTKFNKLGASRI